MLPNGYKKAVTFSFDDGITQDVRLIEIFNRYGLKCTFNINSALLGNEGSLIRNERRVSHDKVRSEDVRHIYSGHEVAAHTLTHPNLCSLCENDIVSQVEDDRIRLSELCGYEVCGMAYPCGGVNNDERVADVICRKTGIKYARTISETKCFDRSENLYRLNPTEWSGNTESLFELGERFISLSREEESIFFIWGHSFEFDAYESWGIFEDFCKMISGKKDIFYGTNSEILL